VGSEEVRGEIPTANPRPRRVADRLREPHVADQRGHGSAEGLSVDRVHEKPTPPVHDLLLDPTHPAADDRLRLGDLAIDTGGRTVERAGREIALSLSNKGAQAVFAYAGLTGSGVFDAAKSGKGVAPIGVVSDKSSLAPGKTPGSLLMGVDRVLMDLTRSYVDDNFERGSRHTFGFAEGGWSMSYDPDLVGEENIADLDALEQKIESGELKVRE
jgi:hypothetical protein